MIRSAALLALVTGCGATTSLPAFDDAAALDGRIDAPSQDDARVDACIPGPVRGESCVPGSRACDDGVDACCRGFVWNCDDGTWRTFGVGCACRQDAGEPESTTCGDAACGADAVCATFGHRTGAVRSECATISAVCRDDRTCACLRRNPPNDGFYGACVCVDDAGTPRLSCPGS
jgi:hypothetical protein